MKLEGALSWDRSAHVYLLAVDAPVCGPDGKSVDVVELDTTATKEDLSSFGVRGVRVEGQTVAHDGGRPIVVRVDRAAGR